MAEKKAETEIANGPPAPTPEERVESWKEIAAYLSRDVRTVQRWEKSEALPVHRHMHDKLGTVYAYKAELDAWWNNRRPKLEAKEAGDAKVARKNRTWWVAASAAVIAAAVVAGYWLTRPPALPFEARDWVLITQFENRTGEAVLDGTLEYALERELSNSRFVNVVPPERIGDALRLMRKPPDTPVDAAIGREIVARDGDIRALITGRVEKLESTYVLSAALVNPANGVTVASLSEQAVGHEQLLPAVGRLAIRVRETLGEELAHLQADTQKLEKATTPSLRALQLFSRGSQLKERREFKPAEEMLRAAIAEDPDFASAHLWLAFALMNQCRPKEEYLGHARRALELSENVSEQERYFIRGSYHSFEEEYEKAIPPLEALLRIYPDHRFANQNLASAYQRLGRHREAVPYLARSADLRPNDWRLSCQVARAFAVTTRSVERARPYVERTRALVATENLNDVGACIAWVELFLAHQYWLQGDVDKALAEANRVQETRDRLTGSGRNSFAAALVAFYGTLGKLKAAEESARLIAHTPTRQEYEMGLAASRGDRQRLKELLGTATPRGPGPAKLLARAGLVSEAERVIRGFERTESSEDLLWVRAEVALAKGQTQKALALVEEDARLNPPTDADPLPAAPSRLSRIYEQQGELSKAIQILEAASGGKAWAAANGWFAPWDWMEWQAELARLYRKAGRDEDARRVEAELQKLLIYADPDHLIVRQLKESKDLAAKQPR